MKYVQIFHVLKNGAHILRTFADNSVSVETEIRKLYRRGLRARAFLVDGTHRRIIGEVCDHPDHGGRIWWCENQPYLKD